MFFVPLAAAFIFYGFENPRFAKKWLLWAAAGALVLAIPLTGSRTQVYELVGVMLCVFVAALFGVSQFTRSIKVIAALVILISLISFCLSSPSRPAHYWNALHKRIGQREAQPNRSTSAS